jgi:superoxide dismutase, Cu-Zn family
MVRKLTLVALMVMMAGWLTACSEHSKPPAVTGAAQTAIARIQPAKNAPEQTIAGTILFNQQADGVLVIVDLIGLPPGNHGFHIHEKGDLSAPDLTSAGGHFNPTHQPHGAPTSAHRHSGDLGNITADRNGVVHLDMMIAGMKLAGPDGIIGRSIIVHAKPDDFTTQPTGNSGARIAGGIIQAGQ